MPATPCEIHPTALRTVCGGGGGDALDRVIDANQCHLDALYDWQDALDWGNAQEIALCKEREGKAKALATKAFREYGGAQGGSPAGGTAPTTDMA